MLTSHQVFLSKKKIMDTHLSVWPTVNLMFTWVPKICHIIVGAYWRNVCSAELLCGCDNLLGLLCDARCSWHYWTLLGLGGSRNSSLTTQQHVGSAPPFNPGKTSADGWSESMLWSMRTSLANVVHWQGRQAYDVTKHSGELLGRIPSEVEA
jgi:hypothetical protein